MAIALLTLHSFYIIPQFSYGQTSMEMNKIRSELNEKRSVIQRLQMELNRREEEEANDMVESLKGVIANLEKENSCLKVDGFVIPSFFLSCKKYLASKDF